MVCVVCKSNQCKTAVVDQAAATTVCMQHEANQRHMPHPRGTQVLQLTWKEPRMEPPGVSRSVPL